MNRARTPSVSRVAVVETARLDPTFGVERQLLAQEEILGGQARVRAHTEREPLKEITEQRKDDARHHRRADDTPPLCPTHSRFGTRRCGLPFRPDPGREEYLRSTAAKRSGAESADQSRQQAPRRRS
jgi:hypothetical protein